MSAGGGRAWQHQPIRVEGISSHAATATRAPSHPFSSECQRTHALLRFHNARGGRRRRSTPEFTLVNGKRRRQEGWQESMGNEREEKGRGRGKRNARRRTLHWSREGRAVLLSSFPSRISLGGGGNPRRRSGHGSDKPPGRSLTRRGDH